MAKVSLRSMIFHSCGVSQMPAPGGLQDYSTHQRARPRRNLGLAIDGELGE